MNIQRRENVAVCVIVLQTAAVWSFDWPPVDRTASWKYGLFPSVKEEQVGPSARFLNRKLHRSIWGSERVIDTERERERSPLNALTLKSLQNKRILLVCGINQLQSDSLIMHPFKTFCWNTAAERTVTVSVRERACVSVAGEKKEIRCIYPLWHLYLVRPMAEQEHCRVCSCVV